MDRRRCGRVNLRWRRRKDWMRRGWSRRMIDRADVAEILGKRGVGWKWEHRTHCGAGKDSGARREEIGGVIKGRKRTVGQRGGYQWDSQLDLELDQDWLFGVRAYVLSQPILVLCVDSDTILCCEWVKTEGSHEFALRFRGVRCAERDLCHGGKRLVGRVGGELKDETILGFLFLLYNRRRGPWRGRTRRIDSRRSGSGRTGLWV